MAVGMESPVHRSVRLSTGLSTSYLEQGRPGVAPPLVLLHAWGESKRAFLRLLAALPRSMHVVAPDLRGHGEADKPDAGYGLPQLACDVTALLDLIDVESAVLVGASSGGYVAQQVAVGSPGRVVGLVLAGSPRTLLGRAPFADQLDALTDPISPEWVREFTTGFSNGANVPDWYVDLLVEDALRIPAQAWRASLAGLSESTPPTTFGSITAPTLIISGEQDQLLSRDEYRTLASVIPGSRWLEYADTGHLVLWEQPERLADDITMFVTGQSLLG